MFKSNIRKLVSLIEERLKFESESNKETGKKKVRRQGKVLYVREKKNKGQMAQKWSLGFRR